jgi:hypothetical protein
VSVKTIYREDWPALFCGVFLLMFAINGIGTRTATIVYRTVKRSEDGYLYWFAVGTALILGTGSLLLFFIIAEGIARDSWALLPCGICLLGMTVDALRSGNAIFSYANVTRSRDPFRYWCAVGVGLTGGIFFLVFFVKQMMWPGASPFR